MKSLFMLSAAGKRRRKSGFSAADDQGTFDDRHRPFWRVSGAGAVFPDDQADAAYQNQGRKVKQKVKACIRKKNFGRFSDEEETVVDRL